MMEGSPALAGTGQVHPAIEVNHRARMEILFAVLLGLFLSALDQTIVGPVLPHIVTDLKGADLYTWVVTAYLLTSTVTIPVYGKLSDLYGRRPLLMIGIVLFLIGSALSGLSQTMWQLIAFRAVQGLGAGALFPISLAVIGDLFTPAERGKYQGLFGAVFGVAFLVGPFLGGYLTDNISWHWVFYVNVPVGVDLALLHLAPAADREDGGQPIQPRHPGRRDADPRHRADLGCPHPRRERRLVGAGRCRRLRRGHRVPGRLPARRVAGRGPGGAAVFVPQPDLRGVRGGDASSPASASPSPSSSCPCGSR